MREKIVCKECGAISVEYRFAFNKGLAVFLRKLFEAEGPVKTDALELTYSQRTNSQKVRYWGLAVPHVNEEAKKKAGWWVITEKGRKFVRGEISIPRYAFTKRGQVTKLEGDPIRMREASGGWEHRDDYRKQAREQLDLRNI